MTGNSSSSSSPARPTPRSGAGRRRISCSTGTIRSRASTPGSSGSKDDWELVDDGLSSNGTFVNGKRLSGRCRLNDGDTLRFGTTTSTFRSPEREQSGTGDAAETPAAVSLSTSQRRVLVALCRPYKGRSGFASPATDQQIAEELFLSVGAVKTHLRVLYAKLGIEELSPNEKRVRLVERAFSAGLISERDL